MGTCQDAYIHGVMYDIGDYPGLILNDTHKVYGELYTLPRDFSFNEFDAYEGYNLHDPENSEFLRILSTVYTINPDQNIYELNLVKTWVYVYNQPILNLKKIPDEYYLHCYQKVQHLSL